MLCKTNSTPNRRHPYARHPCQSCEVWSLATAKETLQINQLLKKHGHYVIVTDNNRVNHLKDCVPLTHSMVTPKVPTVQLTFLWLDFSMISPPHVRAYMTLRRLKPSPGIDITWSHDILNCFIILEVSAGSQAIHLIWKTCTLEVENRSNREKC